MKITIVGPRSVGKSTASKILAANLNLEYISSDNIMNKAMKKYGGLDKVIKSGETYRIIEVAVSQLEDVMKKDDFVYDLAGGAISSTKNKEVVDNIKAIVKANTIVVGLLPYKNKNRSLEFLFNREKEREHFKNENHDKLHQEVEDSYNRLEKIIPRFCTHVIYVESKSPQEIANEIKKKIK
ncbi:MAG: shikimate kinase [Nanoarchaeota archaeon]|nr:shikimate kinase [Nanoarchaeota archaeon]